LELQKEEKYPKSASLHQSLFYVVQKIHIATGHGGRDKMIKEANKKYANVSKEALELFKELCEECQLKERKQM
jgi:TRAP-type C4-dicarboxylate transport system substrate-binding protein